MTPDDAQPHIGFTPEAFVAPVEARCVKSGRMIPLRWVIGPLLLALMAIVLGEGTDIDRAVTRLAYDSGASMFPLRHAFWLDVIMHHWAKYAVATLGVVMLAGFMLSFALHALAPYRRVLLFVMLAMSLAPLSVTVGKALSTAHCPWDVVEFGGLVPYGGKRFTPATGVAPGHCFPAGHAATGFALMAFYFAAFALRRQRAARILLLTGLAAGLILGMGRVLQGAHFVSHVVWAGGYCWAVMVLLYWLVLSPRVSTEETTQPPSANSPEARRARNAVRRAGIPRSLP